MFAYFSKLVIAGLLAGVCISCSVSQDEELADALEKIYQLEKVVEELIASSSVPPAETIANPVVVSTTTSAASNTTEGSLIDDPSALEPIEALEEEILLTDYSWGQSGAASALQLLLGLEEDGYYGNITRNAHIQELELRGLSTGGVPVAPTTNAPVVPTTNAPVVPTTTAPDPYLGASNPAGSPLEICWSGWEENSFGAFYGTAHVSWGAPSNDGGAPIVSYGITGLWRDNWVESSPGSVTLEEVAAYSGITMVVKVTNAAGLHAITVLSDSSPYQTPTNHCVRN